VKKQSVGCFKEILQKSLPLVCTKPLQKECCLAFPVKKIYIDGGGPYGNDNSAA